MANTTHEPLTNTLVLALTQCQDQVRRSQSYQRTILQLEQENAKLREELREIQDAYKLDITQRQLKQRVEELCEKDIENRVHNDALRSKLRRYKLLAKQHGLLSPPTSSPLPSSIGAEATFSELRNEVTRDFKADSPTALRISTPHISGFTHMSSATRKRPRSESPIRTQPLAEIAANARSARNTSSSEALYKRSKKSAVQSLAIPAIAEDGENYIDDRVDSKSPMKEKNMAHTSAHRRLGNLMASPAPTRPILLQQSAVQSNSSDEHQGDQKKVDRTSISAPDLRTSPTGAVPRPPPNEHILPTTAITRRVHGIQIAKPAVTKGPEDEEPYRSRPLSRLDLTHFKLNPKANAGLDYAFNEIVRGRKERRCLPGCTRPGCCGDKFSVLAETLLHTPGGQDPSDDQLLLRHLGPGSEGKIRALTPVARQNLLHDAKTRLIADTYGKQHRNVHERQRSPPGYWTTDMPGSQEHKTHLTEARLRERDEVARRHQEALKQDGRWLFADE